MTIDSLILAFAPLAVSFVLSLIILERMRLFSSNGGFYFHKEDIPDQSPHTIEIGGVAFFPIILIALCLTMGTSRLLAYHNLLFVELGISGDRILQVLVGCSLLYIVGLKHDIHGVWPHTKFIALLVTAAMFPLSGLWIQDLQGLFGIHSISPWIGIPMTIILVMYITEVIVLLDDMDGVGMGFLSIMQLFFLGISVTYGFVLGILVSGAALGISMPYVIMKLLRPSWKKMIVGNAGSYPLGYLLSYATLSLIHPAGIEMPNGTLMIVIGIIMVPMVDFLRTLRVRVREGRALTVPDRNQMQHRFIRMGVGAKYVPVIIVVVVSLFAALNTLWVVMAQNITLLAIIDIILWGMLTIGGDYLIRLREERMGHTTWVMTYGREAWEADIPTETIQRKHERFGTLGLAPQYIKGEETEFIPDGMTRTEKSVKRAIDFVIATLLMIVLSPLFLLCYFLIKCNDFGPAIYRQERIGRYGTPFYIYKFRSMREDAEADGPMLSHGGGEDDPRLTKVGKFLRAHHLDELPQLWNIFRGDMSFVGYRPERAYYIQQILEHDPRYTMLYQIRPGVTSYATLYNGYTDTMEKMLRRLNYDLYYLENRSFWFDCRVLWLTFINILFGKKF